MKLAFASNAFKRNTLVEAIDAIAAAGYGGVELMADLHHAHPLTFTAARRRETKSQLAALGLFVSNVNAFTHFVDGDTYRPTWIETDAHRVRTRIEHTIGSIELAAEFGCRTVSIQPGGPTIGRRESREALLGQFAEGLSACVSTAKACGVTIGVEPEPGLLIQTAAEFAEFKRQYFSDEPSVRMNCDVGHLFCVGEDPAAVIHRWPELIAHVHLEDIGANRVHQHLMPGAGVIDFDSIRNALKETGYGGPVTVELYPFESDAAAIARRSAQKIQPIWPR